MERCAMTQLINIIETTEASEWPNSLLLRQLLPWQPHIDK